ncbi:tRNA glutamyl-Q(34) synthetase GluQRS [Loktanella sp. S4079]|uniref:tRNA glutamyl-Q(34) synthetase GluQRS n=1 Tax=Loktanella sp. S4079 TaxID=579483 RepID=UPI0005F9D85F|nr:tRNA glutamyl-Q(34) synthetase GluQRS [Loktanella sp. S4079]KJZ20190.1 glutamyl-tRNA synthetase [Loktanella sp. S4079]
MITRFAPSPTGPLHLGHALSALTVWDVAAHFGGTALLRIEDTDSTRARPQFEEAIYQDLTWLGLTWPLPVRRQSDHYADYQVVIEQLAERGLVYPCSCTRRDIQNAGAKPGVEGLVYPGICRSRPMSDAKPGDAIRLNLQVAVSQIQTEMTFVAHSDDGSSTIEVDPNTLLSRVGDTVLIRKNTGDPAYHLACVHDDALQKVTHVVRGMDLWEQTPIQVLLQTLMGWPRPEYHHHRLITDENGKRLAKIDRSKALSKYRAEGASPSDIRRMIGMAE